MTCNSERASRSNAVSNFSGFVSPRPLVARRVDAAVAQFDDRLDQARRAAHREGLMARGQGAPAIVGLAQSWAVDVEPARLRAA